MRNHKNIIVGLFFLLGLSVMTECSSPQSNPDAENLYNLGKQWRDLHQLDSAINYFFQAEVLVTSETDSKLATDIYANIGDLLQLNKNYALALDYYEKAVNVCMPHNPKSAAYLLMDMGTCHRRKGDSLAVILPYYQKALSVFPNDTVTGDIIQQIGLSYYFRNHYDSARHYLYKSLGYPFWGYKKAVRLLFLGNLFYKTNQLDSAEYYLLQSLNSNPELRPKSGCYMMLHKIAEQRGDVSAIAHYASLHAEYSDSISAMDAKLGSELHDIQTTRNAELHAQKVRHSRWLVLSALLLCFAGSICWYSIKAYKKRKQQAELERARRKELEIHLAHEAAEQKKLQQQKKHAMTENKVLLQKLEMEIQQRKTIDQLQEQLMHKLETEQTRELEKRRQAYMAHLQKACREAERYPALSSLYKKTLFSAYDRTMQWNDTERFLALINADFNRFAEKIETHYQQRRSSNHVTARLCSLCLLNVPEEHIAVLMKYTPSVCRQSMCRLYERFNATNREELQLCLFRILTEE